MTLALAKAPAPPLRVAGPLDPYNTKKGLSMPIARQLAASKQHWALGQNIARCAETLGLRLDLPEDGPAVAHLQAVRTCQARVCPFCEWRKSRAWRARLLRGLGAFREEFPTHKALVLTLTSRNQPLASLGAQVQELHDGWNRLKQCSFFPTKFWFRRTECTLPARPMGEQGPRMAHPHLHCLLLVPASYWSRDYIKQTTWQKEWQMAARLDYSPVVDVRAAYVSKKVDDAKPIDTAAVCEAAKYLSKATELIALGPDLVTFHEQMRGLRLYGVSRPLSQFIRSDEIDSVEMTDEAECAGPLSDSQSFVNAYWDRLSGCYQLRTLGA